MIYALKTAPTANDEFSQPKIFQDLKNGKGRFGWSFTNNGNLLEIQNLLQGNDWNYSSLDDSQHEIWSNTNFLLNIEINDYIVYINLPSYGRCSIGKVTNKYNFDKGFFCDDFDYAEGCLDFRHYIPVKFMGDFLRNGRNVHPHLYRRLVLQGRWWRIYAEEEFNELLNSLDEEKGNIEITLDHTLNLFSEEIEEDLKSINQKILHTHPNKSLEEFIAFILKGIPIVFPESVEIKKGRSDFGADIIAEYRNEIINSVEKIAIQAKAYEGTMGYQKAINDIDQAFKHDNSFTQGLIIGTAIEISNEFENALENLRKKHNKPIGLLIGTDLAKWVLKFLNLS